MADVGPYAHLNNLSARERQYLPRMQMGDGQHWPAVLAQDPNSGAWTLVPVDPNGHPRFDLIAGASGNWKTIDPSDSNALKAAGVDLLGLPHDYSWRGRLTDSIENSLGWVTSLIPHPYPEQMLPVGGLRGELEDDNVGGLGRPRWASLDGSEARSASQYRRLSDAERPEMRIPPPIFFS